MTPLGPREQDWPLALGQLPTLDSVMGLSSRYGRSVAITGINNAVTMGSAVTFPQTSSPHSGPAGVWPQTLALGQRPVGPSVLSCSLGATRQLSLFCFSLRSAETPLSLHSASQIRQSHDHYPPSLTQSVHSQFPHNPVQGGAGQLPLPPQRGLFIRGRWRSPRGQVQGFGL